MNSQDLAPIVLFVYNRISHTKKTIEALKNNALADQTDLFIYSDSAKNTIDYDQVSEVRKYLKTIRGFKSIKIIERIENFGLAKNIYSGVSEIISKYGYAIVMEDDIIASPAYLSFMNQALHKYKNNKNVWHISGWNYPIISDSIGDAFFWRAMNCWGWATWADRWAHFEKNPQNLINTWDDKKIHHFDLDGSNIFWNQILSNAEGKINTWAIFWYATIHQNDGLCLNPSHSYVENIGHDGTGVNCGNTQTINKKHLNLCENFNINFPENFNENPIALSRIKQFYLKEKKSYFSRAVNKIARLIIGKNVY